MSNNGNFPTSINTATTKVTPFIWFDPSYIKTPSGLLKSMEIAGVLLGFICGTIGDCHGCSSVAYFCTTTMLCFWISLLLLAAYMFHVIEKLHNIPWLLVEVVYCAVTCLLIFIGSIVIILDGAPYAAAGFFGIFSSGIYFTDSAFKFQAYQRGEIAQGERKINASPSRA
ncbi:CKLF-like MARVEL transmembrane domain-containing protein 4 [Panonychus citri]|uniref:CKLF-like MARVEL transmembrane domain-containing protein 4 n=1 Tax=Panonychus citri TaxID=50023 RepID=UPI002307B682|nr:CKLF-like MARVEL transmembrane domain-containing protein 4 [Panonychus citri]